MIKNSNKSPRVAKCATAKPHSNVRNMLPGLDINREMKNVKEVRLERVYNHFIPDIFINRMQTYFTCENEFVNHFHST